MENELLCPLYFVENGSWSLLTGFCLRSLCLITEQREDIRAFVYCGDDCISSSQ